MLNIILLVLCSRFSFLVLIVELDILVIVMVLKVFFSLVNMLLFGLVVCEVCMVSFFRLLLVGSRLMLVLIRLM